MNPLTLFSNEFFQKLTPLTPPREEPWLDISCALLSWVPAPLPAPHHGAGSETPHVVWVTTQGMTSLLHCVGDPD